MKGKEVLKKLEKLGWVVINIEGSHHKVYNKEMNKTVIIPCHSSKELGVGLLNKILKQAGLK